MTVRRLQVVSAGQSARAAAAPPRQRKLLIVCLSLYNLAICLLLLIVLFAQIFGIIWSSVTAEIRANTGRSPLLGPYAFPSDGVVPVSDRLVVCAQKNRYYRPIQLSALIKLRQSKNTTVHQWVSNGVDGFRVVSRASLVFDAAQIPYYVRQCDAILRTIENIFAACERLGFNVTRDVLRVVDGIASTTVITLENALPVVIIPYWDLADSMSYVVPGHDGSACVFRATGIFTSESETTIARLSGVTRSLREGKVEKWLGYPGGVWRNGWYEDPVMHMRWNSEIISSNPDGELGIPQRQFDLLNNATEIDCSRGCGGGVLTTRWDDDLISKFELGRYDSVQANNGSSFGLSQFQAQFKQTVESKYDLSKLISNLCFLVLLTRWMFVLVALYPVDAIGIGALANVDSFQYLPFLLIPRLKASLIAFWTVGCSFQGPQIALESAWFEIYPAIGEVLVLFFCLLNMLGKLLRRRMSDTLFGPTLLFFCLLHYFRAELMASSALGIDGRAVTVVSSDELDAASLFDVLLTDLAFQVNGRIKILFRLKLAVLGVNLFPLLYSRRVTDDKSGATDLRIERALAVQLHSNGGLGSTRSPYTADGSAIRAYEIVRLGYVLVGSTPSALVGVDHWVWLVLGTVVHRVTNIPFRVVILEVMAKTGHLKVAAPALVDTTGPKVKQLAVARISCRSLA